MDRSLFLVTFCLLAIIGNVVAKPKLRLRELDDVMDSLKKLIHKKAAESGGDVAQGPSDMQAIEPESSPQNGEEAAGMGDVEPVSDLNDETPEDATAGETEEDEETDNSPDAVGTANELEEILEEMLEESQPESEGKTKNRPLVPVTKEELEEIVEEIKEDNQQQVAAQFDKLKKDMEAGGIGGNQDAMDREKMEFEAMRMKLKETIKEAFKKLLDEIQEKINQLFNENENHLDELAEQPQPPPPEETRALLKRLLLGRKQK